MRHTPGHLRLVLLLVVVEVLLGLVGPRLLIDRHVLLQLLALVIVVQVIREDLLGLLVVLVVLRVDILQLRRGLQDVTGVRPTSTGGRGRTRTARTGALVRLVAALVVLAAVTAAVFVDRCAWWWWEREDLLALGVLALWEALAVVVVWAREGEPDAVTDVALLVTRRVVHASGDDADISPAGWRVALLQTVADGGILLLGRVDGQVRPGLNRYRPHRRLLLAAQRVLRVAIEAFHGLPGQVGAAVLALDDFEAGAHAVARRWEAPSTEPHAENAVGCDVEVLLLADARDDEVAHVGPLAGVLAPLPAMTHLIRTRAGHRHTRPHLFVDGLQWCREVVEVDIAVLVDGHRLLVQVWLGRCVHTHALSHGVVVCVAAEHGQGVEQTADELQASGGVGALGVQPVDTNHKVERRVDLLAELLETDHLGYLKNGPFVGSGCVEGVSGPSGWEEVKLGELQGDLGGILQLHCVSRGAVDVQVRLVDLDAPHVHRRLELEAHPGGAGILFPDRHVHRVVVGVVVGLVSCSGVRPVRILSVTVLQRPPHVGVVVSRGSTVAVTVVLRQPTGQGHRLAFDVEVGTRLAVDERVVLLETLLVGLRVGQGVLCVLSVGSGVLGVAGRVGAVQGGHDARLLGGELDLRGAVGVGIQLDLCDVEGRVDSWLARQLPIAAPHGDLCLLLADEGQGVFAEVVPEGAVAALQVHAVGAAVGLRRLVASFGSGPVVGFPVLSAVQRPVGVVEGRILALPLKDTLLRPVVQANPAGVSGVPSAYE
mmetsp:Transcript_47663/g.119197  ORF Transcript_47663/g.119197 Transcript_47663/m.119197 type:complete len:769 (+) Transcript_47663:907-3213(+)